MIYPTGRAVLLLALGAPFALLLAVIAPGVWTIGLVWSVLVVGFVVADTLLAMRRDEISITRNVPAQMHVGGSDPAEFRINFQNDTPPPGFETRLETNALIRSAPADSALGAGYILTPQRRGIGVLDQLWLRWRGPFGLVYRQICEPLNVEIPITPDTRTVAKEAMRIFSRDAMFGAKLQLDKGDGTEFDALRDFTSGMDKRTIDWKQSARHRQLIAKEFRNERNHPIHFAIDTGRLMSQPLQGVPRVDRAINAALLMAYVSLKMGDRVGFFGFDARPSLVTGAVSGAQSFPLLQRLTTGLEYTNNETNFTLGLTRLSAQLERRSLIVIFTDFADTTSAELMIENMGRLLKRHLVILVAFRDEELETLIAAEPREPDDVSRAVVAAELLKERDIVLSRLQRLGAEIVEAPADTLNMTLLNRYIDLKNRDRL